MSHKWDTDFASENPEHAKGLAPATGPDTRQPDMVSKDIVLTLLEQLKADWAEDCEVIFDYIIGKVEQL